MNRFKQKTGKRVLAFLIVFALLIPMIPAPVYAAEPTSQEKYEGYIKSMTAAATTISAIAAVYGEVDLGNGYEIDLKTDLNHYVTKINKDLSVAAAIVSSNYNDPVLTSALGSNKTNYNDGNFKDAFKGDRYALANKYLEQGGIAFQKYGGILGLQLQYFFYFKSNLNPNYTATPPLTSLTETGKNNIVNPAKDYAENSARLQTVVEGLQQRLKELKDYKEKADELESEFLKQPCAKDACEHYGSIACIDWTHRLLVPESQFTAAVDKFKGDIERDIQIASELATGKIDAPLWFENNKGKAYYNDTAAPTATGKINAAIAFLENGGYTCGSISIIKQWESQLSYRSNFNSGYTVEIPLLELEPKFQEKNISAVAPLVKAMLSILQSGVTADNVDMVYNLKVSEINDYIEQIKALRGTTVPEGGMYNQAQFDSAIEDFITKAETDLVVAESLKTGDLDKNYIADGGKDFDNQKIKYQEKTEAERLANAIRFFNEGGYTYTPSNILEILNYFVYESKFDPDYNVLTNKINVVAIMRDTAAALQLGNRYMTAVELAKYQYDQSLDRLQAIKEDPSGIVTALLNNDQELKKLIADLNTILSSLDDIIDTMKTLERLGIGRDILDPILSQAGLSYDMLNQLAQLRDTLEAIGIDTSGNIPIEDSLDVVAGSLVGSLIDLAILGANATASLGTESAYKTAASALDTTYNSLMENAANAVNKLLAPISAVVNPIRPYLGMLNSSVSMVNNVAVLVEQVDQLQDDFTVGGLSKATYTTADTMDDLADFLEAFQAAGLGDLFTKLLENSNLGGTVADGTAAMLNQLAKELIKQDLELSGSDFDLIQKTVDELAKRGLENPTALVPMLRASADVLRRAAELEGGIQDAIDGNYEAAWNALTKDLGGMISKTVTFWNTIVALYDEPEAQDFVALAMNRQTGELNLDSLDEDEFLESFGQGINMEAEATFQVLIDPKCSDSEKLAAVYKFWNFLKDVKAFVSDLEDASKGLNEAHKWAEQNLTKEEAKAFIENMGRHYAAELLACIKEGLDSSSIKKICKEIEESVAEMRDLLNYIKCTGELEILATPGEDEVYYTLATNYDSLRDRLSDVLSVLGISTGFKVNTPADQFKVDGDRIIAIGDLEDGTYEVKVSYQMYFAVCHRDFASTLATKWVTVNYSGGSEEPEPDLTRIEITKLPSRTAYSVGESLDLAGLEVMAYYSDESKKVVDLVDCDIDPAAGAILDNPGEGSVTVTYRGYSDSFKITVTDNESDLYKVRFDTNGGVLLDEAKDSLSVKDGTEITLPRAAFANHTFDGWFDEESTLAGKGGDLYTISRDVLLIAQWTEIVTKKEFTVKYVTNGGTLSDGAAESVKTEEGSKITLPSVTRSGYTFDGWYNGTSRVGIAGDVYTVNSDITFEARWSSNGGGGGGGGRSSSSKQILDEEVPLSGIYALMSLPAEPKDGIVYYVIGAGETVFVPFCYTIEDKIYFLGQTGIEYHVKANPKQFGDIAGNWSYGNILAIASREAFQGYPDNSFQPGSPMTRAMLSAVLARMAMVDISSYKTRVFDDVSPDAWYGPSVAWAYEQGIVTGVGGRQFNPNANITRQEFSVMLSRFINFMSINLKAETVAPFTDEDQASAWAKTAINDMKRYNIVTGRAGNLFDPYSDVTRAEITAMLYRLIQYSITYEYENGVKEAKKVN